MLLSDFDDAAVAMEFISERRRLLNSSCDGNAVPVSLEEEDCHTRGEMALAAASYALYASGHDELFATISRQPHGKGSNCGWVGAAALFWPKAWGAFNPWGDGGRRACLIRAGQLIMAEVERLDRAKASGKCLECLGRPFGFCGACGGTRKVAP